MQDTNISYRAAEARKYGIAVAILLGNIRVFTEYHNQKGGVEYWHSMKDIAEAVGLSTKQISSAAKKAQEAGLIQYKQGYKPGTQTRTTYWSMIDARSTSESDKRSTSSINIKELNIKDCAESAESESNVSNKSKPKADERVIKSWYDTLSRLDIPIRNHNNTRLFAIKLQKAMGIDSALYYLDWVRDNLPSPDPFCPQINNDSDLFAKYAQLRNYKERPTDV